MARRLSPSLLMCALVAGCLPATTPQDASSPVSSNSGGVAAGRTREGTIVEVQNDVRRQIEARYRGDVEALAEYANRAIASSAFTGRTTEADIRKALQDDVDRVKSANVELESVAFHGPAKFAETSERLYAIVPFTLVEKNRTTGERTQVVSFSTGILEPDAGGFFYFDGPIPIEKMRERLPDLPMGYAHPEHSVTTLTAGRSDRGDTPSAASTEGSSEPTASDLQADVRRRIEAMFAGDAETILRYTPDGGKTVGGEARARELIQAQMEVVRRMKVELESVEFPVDPTIYAASERTFAVIPYSAMLRSRENGEGVRLTDYAIGIREPDSSEFRYMEGGIARERLRALYPDFPTDIRVPKTGVTKIPK